MVTLKLKLNYTNGQIIATFLLYSSFLLYFSFSFQAWDSICFYCCWCLTLLDTFVIGEVRWEPQSCYETNTLWSEYKNYVQKFMRPFFIHEIIESSNLGINFAYVNQFFTDLTTVSLLSMLTLFSNSWFDNPRGSVWSEELPRTMIYPNFDPIGISRAQKIENE